MHHLASVMARGGERGGRGVVAGGSSGVRAARAASGVAFNRQACEDDRGSRGVCGVPHTSGTTIRRVNSLRRMWRPLDCTPDSGSWRGGHFQRRTRRPNSRDTCGPVLPPQRTAAAGSAASAQMQPSSSSSSSAAASAASSAAGTSSGRHIAYDTRVRLTRPPFRGQKEIFRGPFRATPCAFVSGRT